jgi:hypothetical protein
MDSISYPAALDTQKVVVECMRALIVDLNSRKGTMANLSLNTDLTQKAREAGYLQR